MKRSIAILLILITLASCSTNKNAPIKEMHNIGLGVNINLGDSKENIDKIFGKCIVNDGYYFYPDGDLSVQYIEGKVFMMITNKDQWVAMNNITVGMSSESFIKNYGITLDDSTMLMFDNKLKITKDKTKAKLFVSVKFVNERIDNITLLGSPR